MTEVSGPMGQLTAQISAGYGFAAIIVAFVGRLHPVGILASSLIMALFFLGGEQAQQQLNLPSPSPRFPGNAAVFPAGLGSVHCLPSALARRSPQA
jgi:ABC-type uncharacterized transport system permease subunit